ncbi:hypothetical protein [Propionispira raffinosivorans]|uniref:hypothetical protein n=1 Tax=Propionispira raffinosivorans TaxID=86959 RepID=UPI00035C4D6D|nr:hypothetical protein [Propionispira raffinosivorans]
MENHINSKGNLKSANLFLKITKASVTSSPWVKIRSYGIVGIVEIIAKIIEKVVNKAAVEEPKTVEVVAPVETLENTSTEQVVQ